MEYLIRLVFKPSNLRIVTACIIYTIVITGSIQLVSAESPGIQKDDTLRILVIGNSFSNNATQYLPALAKEGKHPLKIQKAEIGGASLEKHWSIVQRTLDDTDDPAGKPYHGASLKMLLDLQLYDYVTIQQVSIRSCDLETFQPFACKLYHFVKMMQPNTTILLHQTWAYREDADGFCQVAENQFAQNDEEMWKKSRASYHAIAEEFGVDIIPVGDAFWRVSNDSLGFTPDTKFDYKNPVFPNTPIQTNSLHRGYFWNNDEFRFDSHHASVAGCYLGASVWYSFLFNESPEELSFVPEGLESDFADYLRKTAWSVTNQ